MSGYFITKDETQACQVEDHAIRLKCLELAIEAMTTRGRLVDAVEWSKEVATIAGTFERYVVGDE